MELLNRFEVLEPHPAVYCEELDALVVADLHLGIEAVAARSGAMMPRFQLGETLDELDELQERCGASVLIVAGDLKHSLSGGEDREREELREFLDEVSMRFEEVLLAKGNHDSALEYRVEDYTNVELDSAFLRSGILFTHGHRLLEGLEAEAAETLVIGHEHPAVALKDEVGVKEKVACFLYGRMKGGRDILVLPAFSRLAAGSEVNEVPPDELLSPILKENVDVDGLQVLAVDREAGTFAFPSLGELRGL